MEMYEIVKLQNCSNFSNQKPTIVITKTDPEWQTTFDRWINGKHPTDSVEWKKGIFAITQIKGTK